MFRKKNSTPTELIYKNKETTNNIAMAESLNDFFVNIGSCISRDKRPIQTQKGMSKKNNRGISRTMEKQTS